MGKVEGGLIGRDPYNGLKTGPRLPERRSRETEVSHSGCKAISYVSRETSSTTYDEWVSLGVLNRWSDPWPRLHIECLEHRPTAVSMAERMMEGVAAALCFNISSSA